MGADRIEKKVILPWKEKTDLVNRIVWVRERR